MKVAYLTFSPDDGGWYAEIVDAETGAELETLPAGDDVFETRTEALKVIERKHGSIRIIETAA